jgi:integrase
LFHARNHYRCKILKKFRLTLFVVGINTALRISDLLTLQIGDFVEADGTLRTSAVVREEKRGKRNVVTFNTSIAEALTKYLMCTGYLPVGCGNSIHGCQGQH